MIFGKHKTYQKNQSTYGYGYGTAPNANIILLETDQNAHYGIEGLATDLTQNSTAQSKLAQMSVLNISLGDAGEFLDPHTELNDLDQLMQDWRTGLGLSIVTTAGNYYKTAPNANCQARRNTMGDTQAALSCVSANSNRYGNRPHTMAIGAIDINNVKADYSSAGANLWVSAPGGRWVASTSDIGGMYGQGTSFAAPFVSGVIAQMIEANPNLTWRDIRHILATTARKVDAHYGEYIGRSPFGDIRMRNGWITNAARYDYSEFYGFGVVDVPAALSMANNYTLNLGLFTNTGVKTTGQNLHTLNQGLTPTEYTFNFSASDGVNTVENVYLDMDYLSSMVNCLNRVTFGP